MTGPITEFIILTLKNHATSPSQPPAAWSDVTDTLKSVPGVDAVYTGTQIEDPSKTVLVVQWASPDAFSAFAASESYMPWFASLKAVSAHASPDSPGTAPPLFYKVPFTADSDPAAVLGAPCTEVFVAYGVDDSFAGRTADFAKGLADGRASVEGFHGHAYGEISTPLALEGSGDGEKGPAVTLLLGWDSKQAHLDAKARPGRKYNPQSAERQLAISNNIDLLRTGRKGISMYHVNLKRL